MTPASSAVASNSLYCYVNVTSQVQSVRLVVDFETRLEKLVFPGERLLIEPVEESELEVLRCEAGAIEVERIACFA